MEKTIQTIEISDVLSVYSGRDGKCCCGCSGKHTYRKATQTAGSANRGYAVDDKEVNDSVATKVLNIVKANEGSADKDGSNVSVVVGKRLYVVYLVEGVSAN